MVKCTCINNHDNFTWIGNPQTPLMSFKGHFQQVDMPFWKKQQQCVCRKLIILFVYSLICVDGFSWPCICAAAWDAHCGCWLPSDGTESHPYKELTPLSVLLTDIPSKWYVIYQTMSMNLTSRSPRKAYKIHHVFINLYICKANKWTLAINA